MNDKMGQKIIYTRDLDPLVHFKKGLITQKYVCTAAHAHWKIGDLKLQNFCEKMTIFVK